MRKQQREQILEMLKALSRANDEIKKYLERSNTVVAADLFIKEQETVINIGNLIESYEGEGFVTVSYLEEYCEVLFQAHEDIASNSHFNPNNICKKLNKQLIKIENSVKNDIHVKKEVAFFPYKASMWDSLESVYLKAEEDPDCDAYCVPIPYYDLKPDRTFGQMHYEGLEYPKNIKIVDFRKYDLEERRPDIVYIHNPYDNWNLVTSVDPKYYSSNLKKYTDELVYIPYFVLQEIEPDNQVAIDGMKHFIWTPGVINADKVIVQSEKMKQIYVNEYIKAAKKVGLSGRHIDEEYLKQKFLGTGSPKFEKVVNTKKEDIEIPDEWLKIMKKSDGSMKKVIFYNTGIASLLSYGEKWVDKIEDSLKIFEENQDKIALLWRPHPLIENTMKSMKPEVYAKYIYLRDRYIQQKWGIYDNTVDMNRAVAISDAYYGDSSSIVQLFEKMNKNILLQNPEVNVSEKYRNKVLISFENAVYHDNCLWFSAKDFNGLYRFNLEKNITEKICDFPVENCMERRLYRCVQKIDYYLIFTPLYSGEIAIFNMIRKQITTVNIRNCKDLENLNNYSFVFSEAYEKNVYFFGLYPSILKIDLNNNIIKIIDDLEMTALNKCGYKISTSHFIIKNKVYMIARNTNKLIAFDMIQEKVCVYNIGTDDYHLLCGNYFEEKMWLAGHNVILQLGADYNVIKELNVNERKYGEITSCEDMILAWDFNETGIITFINSETSEITETEINISEKCSYSREKILYPLFEKNKKIVFFDDRDYCIKEYDYNEKKIDIHPVEINRTDMDTKFNLNRNDEKNVNLILSEGYDGIISIISFWLNYII